jgi:hypothetical protein
MQPMQGLPLPSNASDARLPEFARAIHGDQARMPCVFTWIGLS